jgi:hypothetical protein
MTDGGVAPTAGAELSATGTISEGRGLVKATRQAGTARSWVLRASVGTAFAVLAACGSTSHGDDVGASVPGSRPPACAAHPTLAAGAFDATEPTTPRGLACALLAHVPAARGARLTGDKTDTTVSAGVEVGKGVIRYYDVVAYSPDDAYPIASSCDHLDSSYRTMLCRTNPDGTRVVILKAPARVVRSGSAVLIGRSWHPDGSQVLLQLFTRSGQFPQQTAVQVLSDPAVGWRTTAAANAAGRRLPHYSRMHIEVKVGEDDAGPEDPAVSP